MKSVGIYANIKPTLHQGLIAKYWSFSKTLKNMNYDAKLSLAPINFCSILVHAWRLAFAKPQLLLVRYDLLFPFYLLPLMLAGFRGRQIVIEIPTPLESVIVRYHNSRHLINLIKYLITALSIFILKYFPFKIVAYADNDNKHFAAIKKKSYLIIANGVDFDDFAPVKTNFSGIDGTCFTMVCVANASIVHGIDRVIKAMPGTEMELLIVGAGKAIHELRKLSRDQNVEHRVKFVGPLTGEALDEAYEGVHVGLTVLGGHRENLKYASPLKTREYAARGIPAVGSYFDTALDNDTTYPFFRAPADETILDVPALGEFLKQQPAPSAIRKLAKPYFEIQNTLKQILQLFEV